MSVDPNIKQKASYIRTKQKGSEVRESLAAGLESMSEDVVETVDRQDYVEQQLQAVHDSTRGKDVISATEILASQVGADGTKYNNMKERLDAEQNKVTAQLTQTDDKLSNKVNSVNVDLHGGTVNRKPLIVIEIDDGLIQDYSVLFPFLSSRGVPATIALPTSFIKDEPTNHLSWSQIQELVNNHGWDVASHTHNNIRTSPDVSTDMIENEFKLSKKTLEEKGLNSDHFTYVGGVYDNRTIEITKRYFKSSAITNRNPGNQLLPLRSQTLSRSSLLNLTLDSLKTDVDNIVHHKGLLIIYTHGNDFEENPEIQTRLSDIITYAKNLGVEFTTRSKAIEKLGNTVQTTLPDDTGGTQLTKTGQLYQNGEEITSHSPSSFGFTRSGSIAGGYVLSGLKAFPKHLTLTIDSGAGIEESIGFSSYKSITESEQSCKFTRANGGVISTGTSAGVMALDNANQTKIGVIFSRYTNSLTFNFELVGTGYNKSMTIRGMIYY